MRVNQSPSNPVQGGDSKKTEKSSAAQGPQAAQAKRTDKAEAKAAAAGSAKAEISGKAKEMAQAKQAAADAPDVREEKIAALKARIAEGKYKVDAEAIADRMVDDHLKAGIG